MLRVFLWGWAVGLLTGPLWAQQAPAFFRTVSATTTVITALSRDGAMTWSNAAVGITGCVHRATRLNGVSNWAPYADYAVTHVVMTGTVFPYPDFLVIDLSGGTNAVQYPVRYRLHVPPGGWSDAYMTDKMVLRLVPAGTFPMGSPTGELGRVTGETLHAVTLTRPFYIGVFEVTQRQWELVMGNRPSYFCNTTHYATRPVERVSYYDIRENPANTDDPLVEWPSNRLVHAASFMGKLRDKTGLMTLDLPTEAQWEYANRAGMTTALNSGRNLTNTTSDAGVAEVGRYWYNGGKAYIDVGPTNVGTAKVGSYRPNAWGLYDLHGNVAEWCLDWWAAYSGPAIDPEGGSNGTTRVFRGGAWNAAAWDSRSAIRGDSWAYVRGGHIGFRVCRSLPE